MMGGRDADRKVSPLGKRFKMVPLALFVALPLLGMPHQIPPDHDPIEAPPVLEDTETGHVQSRPDDWQEERITDGPGREQAETELQELLEQFEHREPSVFDTGSSFEVRLVDLTENDRQTISSASTDEIPFVARDVPVSFDWLDRTSHVLAHALPNRLASVGVDLEPHRFYVAISESASESRSELQNAALAVVERALTNAHVSDVSAEDLVQFEQGGEIELVEERDNLPVKSGRWVNTKTQGCTAGFLVRSPDWSVIRFSTAGHCFNGAADLSVSMPNGVHVGRRTQSYPGGWDVANFSIPPGSQTQAAITVNSAGGFRQVVNSINPANGTQYCFTGRGSVAKGDNEKCNNQSRTTVKNGKTLYCLERRSHGGDSGGPVYYIYPTGRAGARGTTVLNLTVEKPILADDHFNCYNRIGDISAAGNWSVVLWGEV